LCPEWIHAVRGVNPMEALLRVACVGPTRILEKVANGPLETGPNPNRVKVEDNKRDLGL